MDTFVAQLPRRGTTLGARCAVYRRRATGVDLWGGIADARTGRPWERDTAAVIFSCSKGLLAICATSWSRRGGSTSTLRSRRYWPEFAAARQGRDHRPRCDEPPGRACRPSIVDLSTDDVLAWDPVIQAIEAQRPPAPPEAGHFYHAMTYGWLVGEVIRRVTGHTPGRFFRAQIADPLGLRTWIGLPERRAIGTVAWMEPPLPDEDVRRARESARLVGENPVIERSLTMGGAFAFPAEDGFVTFNDPAIQAARDPGRERHQHRRVAGPRSTRRASPRSTGRRSCPQRRPEDRSSSSRRDRSSRGCPDDGARWGTGFQLASPPSQPMLGSTSFGHAGAGGQLGIRRC